MSVTDFEARFSKLSCHALMILPTYTERVQRFIARLHSGIRAHMARVVEMVTPYQLVVEIARRIEGYRLRDRDQMQQDKMEFSGEFRGSPARGIGPQGSSDSYFNAMPESSYRPLAIHASSSGSTGHQGQPSGQQATAPWGCFECRDLGHMRRYCPRLRGKAVQQGQQPMILAPAAPPPRGGGQTSRGHSRGRGQVGRGQPATTQLGGGQPAGVPARFYALPARPEALASDAIITGIIFICGRDASMLFDPGSTYSYISSLFARLLVISPEPLGTPIHVSTPVGDSVVVDRIY
ncbi:uncharacterized protein [Nicotiana sylvestris]|uniref:uncharacterized protein n=1 Tax=Nicotiana sylvestris TaxID=4096 RepID=UPI00388CEB10